MSLETINFEHLRLTENDKLLDLGCGEGRHALSAYIARDLKVYAVDLSLSDLKTTKSRFIESYESENKKKTLSIAAADAKNLPFQDNEFDSVICSEVLEHIHDYKSVLSEIFRVLKNGGVASVSVPRFFPEWICWQLSDAYHEVKGGHVRIFKKQRLLEEIEETGLRFKKLHYAHALHVPYWWLKCLFWREPGEREAILVRLYHRFLVWDLMKKPFICFIAEKLLNPIMGKSVVMYFQKKIECS